MKTCIRYFGGGSNPLNWGLLLLEMCQCLQLYDIQHTRNCAHTQNCAVHQCDLRNPFNKTFAPVKKGQKLINLGLCEHKYSYNYFTQKLQINKNSKANLYNTIESLYAIFLKRQFAKVIKTTTKKAKKNVTCFCNNMYDQIKEKAVLP